MEPISAEPTWVGPTCHPRVRSGETDGKGNNDDMAGLGGSTEAKEDSRADRSHRVPPPTPPHPTHSIHFSSLRLPVFSSPKFMDSTALARSFPGNGTMVADKTSLSKKLFLPAQFSRAAAIARKQLALPRLKASDASSVLTSDVSAPDKTKAVQKGTFPSGLESMLKDVCDGTSVAEVKLKIGNFQMYLKREVESASVESHPPPNSLAIAPPSMSEPAVTPQQDIEATNKTSSEEQNPFENSSDKDKKLAFMQDHESDSFEIVASPTVGVFMRSKTSKGKKLPSVCKEGMVIKEGQIIGFITQFQNDLPIRSNVAGEVISFLCRDGEPVGYGDPLLAVLPSFHGDEMGL